MGFESESASVKLFIFRKVICLFQVVVRETVEGLSPGATVSARRGTVVNIKAQSFSQCVQKPNTEPMASEHP